VFHFVENQVFISIQLYIRLCSMCANQSFNCHFLAQNTMLLHTFQLCQKISELLSQIKVRTLLSN